MAGRALTLRHRWYAAGLAAAVSAALVFSGVSTPAMADTVPPGGESSQADPSPTSSPPVEETAPPAEETVPPAEETPPPAEETPPPAEETAPPAEETAAPDPAASAPAVEPEPLAKNSVDDAAPLDEVGVLAVPAPGAGEAVITVKVGSDRTGITGVTNLAGVVLLLNTGNNNPSGTRPDGVAGTADGWAKCVSDADGDCSFVVPNTNPGPGGVNRDRRFWVIQSSVPAGYYTNPILRTGPGTGAGAATPYRFRTGFQLRAGSTYSSQNANDFMLSSGIEATASGGIWQQSRTNPTLQASCGLNVALILDLSGSVGNTATLKAAANTFVDSLQGTPSRMSLFSFSTVTPASGAGPNVPSLTSVSTAAQGAAFKNLYASWTAVGGTNWDRGLGIAASSNTAANSFDIAVIITDGDPTNYNQPAQGSGNNNRFRETENGIFSANALKAAGTRVVAFGVGDGATGVNNGLNLRAISGTTRYNGGNADEADYYQTSDYEAVGTALRNLALGNCEGTLTVTKQIVPNTAPSGSIEGAVPAGAGWQFTSVINTAGVTTPTAQLTTVADGTGTVSYPLTFPGTTAAGSVTVTEAQQAGFTLQQVGGQNAVCTNLNTRQPVALTGNPTNGFTVDVPSTQAVNCIVYNRAAAAEANITVTKNWVVNGVSYENGAQPGGLSAQLQLTGPGQAGATDQGWAVARGGYEQGGTTTLSETVTLIDPTMCTYTSVVTNINGTTANIPLGTGYQMSLPLVSNTATITNSVVCESRLTLNKQVDGGDAAPSSWTLHASFLADAPTPTGLPGFSGAAESAAVTSRVVTPEARYQLFETNGDPLYAQTDNRTDLQTNPLSTGSATCIRVDEAGDPFPGSGFSDGINGGVNVPLGYRVSCTFVNQTAELTLLKNVVNDNGGTTTAAAWSLTATPATLAGLSATTVTGSETAVEASTFAVRPGHVYTLTESAVAGYEFSQLQQLVDGEWVDVVASADPDGYPRQDAEGNWQITVVALDDPVYRFVNEDVAPTMTLEKEVDNSGGGTATADAWTLTATANDVNAINGTGTLISENVAAISGEVQGNTTYTLLESGPSGYTSSGVWACVISETSTAVPVTNGNQVTPSVGQSLTCRIVNTAIPATGTVGKSVVSTVQNADGTWTIVYRITVTNGSTTANYTYNLEDTLNFGDGLTPTSATVSTVPAGATAVDTWTGLAPETTLARDVLLTSTQRVHVWEITVVATVAPTVPSGETWECDGGSNPGPGGFLNTVQLAEPAREETPDGTANACSQPSFPEITKTAGTPTQNADASWNVAYTIVVSNPGESAVAATVTDAFPTLPTGWTLDGGVWNVAAQDGAPITNTTSAASPVWSGQLPADTTYTYVVTGRVIPTASATPIGSCETAGEGLTNAATVTSGTVVETDSDCVSITTPPVSVIKTDGTVSQLADGTWQIDYTVTVTNSGEESTVYTLTDTPDLGTGFTVVSQGWVDGAPAADSPIAAGDSYAFTYRVIASFDSATANPELTCDQVDGGAFYNVAQVAFPGGTAEDTGCGEPASPTIEKSSVDAEVTPEGEWTLTYSVAVHNTSAIDLAYAVSDTPAALPADVTVTTPWAVSGPAELEGGSASLTAGWTGTAPNTQFATGRLLAGTTHTYTLTVTVALGAGVDPADLACGSTPGASGFWNNAAVTNGVGTAADDACVSVFFDDVGIAKTTTGVEGPLESNDTFDYVLTVTNNGTREATEVAVSDPIPGRLTVTGIDLTGAPGWTNDNEPDLVGEDNTVAFSAPTLAVGASVEIVVSVSVNAVPVPAVLSLNEGDPVPTPELPETVLLNRACVSATADDDPTNDCAEITVETRDIAALLYTRCVGGGYRLGFSVVKTDNLAQEPLDLLWTPDTATPTTEPASVEKSYPGGTTTHADEFDWVGTVFTPSGVSTDYPGWRGLVAADYAPGGGFYVPGTTDVMTPEQESELIYNGSILDPSELDHAWRNATTVVLSVNPSATFAVTLPDATSECSAARHSEVRIDKNASVKQIDPGQSFTYTLDVANISDDSAADGVVVTDAIPADLKVTAVSWAGQDDPTTFPAWSSCAVTGQNGAGYGGTLRCELFGPLQPEGSGAGASQGPRITVTALLNPSSTASAIRNVGVVDYYTFGDPGDSGRHADGAVVVVAGALPATGESQALPLAMLGLLTLLGGAVILLARRRRESEPVPRI